MATVIQIKRSANVGAPSLSDLVQGELAYSYDQSNDGVGAKLYIEVDNNSGNVIHTIGGKYYTDLIDGATASNTANKLVKRDGSGNFSANVITANEFIGNVTLSNSGVTAGTYGNATLIPVITFDASGRATSAANIAITPSLTASSIATLTNKTFDVSVGSNNYFSIQGNQISSYTGSGSSVVLSQSPTISVLNISDSQINLDGGTGIYYWGGQSGVAQAGDLKAGVYASDPSSNNSLFTFGTNGSNKMSVGVEGSLFVGTAMPSNNGGLSTAYSGWLVVQSGGKFGGDIDTLGGLNLTDATSGKIQFSDGSIQRTAYTSNHLTTANVVEVSNLYFTNTRARAAITSGNTILYDASTGNITLSVSGVAASTYGGSSKVPVLTVDQFGRVTSAANVSVAGVSSFTASGNTFTIATADGGSFSASIQENSVRLGTDTTGDYVKNVIPSTGITVSGATGESRDVTIALADTTVTPLTYGGADKTAVFTVDAQGRLTAASNVTISIPSSALNTDVALGTQTSGAYVANLIAGTGITITGLGNEGTTPTITNSGVTQLTGTANEIEVSGSTGSITIGLPDNVTIGQNLTVTGDLIVNGTALTVNTATVTVEDPLVKFGNANPADSLDIGFFGQYTSSGEKFAGLFRDASDSGKFKLFVDLTTDPTTNVINTANYTVATLVTNLTGGTVSGLTANIAVGDGGTGRGTLTTNSVLYGQGTSAVGMATGSAGQILQLNNSGVPVFGGIDGGTY